ncbi:MAG: anti-sigma factor [Candidatus Binatia bacterium]
MTCEETREELVAYHDEELSAEDRSRVTAHLRSCVACSQEAAQLKKLTQLLTRVERITPSPDFAATFWQKLEQEKHSPAPATSRLREWWKAWRESFPRWQMLPALASAASVVVFLGYLFSERNSVPAKSANTTPVRGVANLDQPGKQPQAPATDIPEPVQKRPGLFVDYSVIADFDRLSHFDEIATINIPQEPPLSVAESDIPQDLMAKPTFFTDYPILQKMEQLQNLETVLDTPVGKDDKNHG